MEFAVGETRWWRWNPPVCEFPWLLAPLYKQVEVRQGWQDRQAAARHSVELSRVCGERMTGCSSKSMVLLSVLGLLALLLCSTSEGEWPQRSALEGLPVLLSAGSRMRLSCKGMVSAKEAVSSPSSVTGELEGWGGTVSALDSRAAWAK